jgi:hypothetical protein
MRGQRTDIDQSNEGILQRIKNKCIIKDNDCWTWTGATNNKGRPQCSIKNKNGLAYRHAYQAYHNKSLSSEVYLCHFCDNPLCCNPEHLFEGDNQLNQLDYASKFETTIVERSSKMCPSGLDGIERLHWYRDNACIIVDNCWTWVREIGKDGYGRVKYKGKKLMIHRFAWEVANNKTIQDKSVIRHSCNNKACCNPEHLVEGSRSENARDANSYSRSVKYDEPVVEWLFLYEIYLNEGNKRNHTAFAKGLRQLGLVSDMIEDHYVVNVLRGKSYKYLHEEFFDWTPSWK